MKKKKGGAFIVLLVCILAAPTVACLMHELPWEWDAALWTPYLLMGSVLGILHVILRPVLRLITLPLGCLTLGLFGMVIDICLIYLSARFVEGFSVSGLPYAVLTALVVNVVSCVTGGRKK